MTCKFLAKRAQLLPEALTSYHRRPSIRPISHDMQIPCKARTTPPRSPDPSTKTESMANNPRNPNQPIPTQTTQPEKYIPSPKTESMANNPRNPNQPIPTQ